MEREQGDRDSEIGKKTGIDRIKKRDQCEEKVSESEEASSLVV